MAILFILLITVLAAANGCLLTYLVVAQASLLARLCCGAVVGLALVAWLGFLAALAAGLSAMTMVIVVTILIAGLLALLRVVPRDLIRSDIRAVSLDRWGLAYYAAWAALLIWLFSRVVMTSAEGMRTAPANNFGDLPFHFSVITSFAYGQNLPPSNPIFAGLKFTYPFLVDFLSALFIRAGADWAAALFVENLVLGLALVGLIEVMTVRLTGNRLAARIAPILFFFNGGFGFIYFFRDLAQSNAGWLDFLAQMPRTYTMNEDLHLRWGNIFTTLLLPQRSLLFGLPMAAMIITLWWMAIDETGKQRDGGTGRRGDGGTEGADPSSPSRPVAQSPSRRYLLAAGLLAGMLPMMHAHGFFSVMMVSGLMALVFWSRAWLAFFIPALILAAPQALWLRGTGVRSELFKPHFGWDAGGMSVITFWLLNAGAFLLLLVVALLMKRFSAPRQRWFYIPFLLCFEVPNVVLLAPWTWDNIKVLVYWYLASCPLVAAVLAYLFTRRAAVWRIAGAVLLLTLTLSGALDVARALSPAENVLLFGRAELEVAELIRERTEPRVMMLAAPIHNSVVALTGRPSLMGYPGHLWTHGIKYGERQVEIEAIYHGEEGAPDLLARHQIDYVVIGPVERQQLQANESFFARYPVVIDHAGYRVYQIKKR